MHRITDEQRRRRLLRRHRLVEPAASVEEAVASVVCLHATEPPSVPLSVAVRSDATLADVEAALQDRRSVVKQLAMRRTLFGFPRELLPAAWGSASARVAGTEAARLAKEVGLTGVAGTAGDGPAWVEQVAAEVLESLHRDGPGTTSELRARLPVLDLRLEQSPGKSYGGSTPVAARVLTLLGARGQVVRGENTVGWRQARPRWTPTRDWLGEVPQALPADEGYRVLVGAWLARFGPGTETDLVWWLGSTKTAVRRALADLGAVQVELVGELGSRGTGWVLPGDEQAPEDDEEAGTGVATLLPVLDPTLMGWKERGFYLDPADVPYLFDSNGNGGTTAWWQGRVVGCWVQDDAGVVRPVVRHDVGAEATAALADRAAVLSDWLAGDRVSTVYASPQMRGERLP
ncbi:Winged helix DNA-binding domain-containing protein [Nocardioides scoriae]|uniref:Winged helix DNA-binding domain-containing protein n=1 Tax=Nocardioides scoriae TaxID=642780 RepID=A0A1H1LV02_9ACTN|nr:winged helix DNA-binding domain-containing protein [Nocardioides scoriae]SDR78247.1 Winged helix DNA-binding domain-containing protein [Nocardioides scoriae]